ncbi:MAG: Asp-tRNA(Asn)/Glu-tRNA(Gln) amidotransferase subunit GatC [Clostridiales Family XIII bacterium]|jgi:aspartyl-tRNA(Asn)/glutamyl-tRNA(Gln) amidotransferase subunit C|nr:Asp-tRNA(Asn)/Glu-tRNA(Gln) amidotransferase subunit GatC [Clostridiales Family XIII bacterium]
MKIDDKLIDYLADLSRLELSDEEKAARAEDLRDILTYMEKLNEVDTEGLPEMTHPFEKVNTFRADEVLNSDNHEKLLENAPEKRGDYFKVPRTVDE